MATYSSSIQPFPVASPSNLQGLEILQSKAEATEVGQSHMHMTSAAQSDHGNMNDAQNHVNGSGEGEDLDTSQPVIDIHINNVVCAYSVRCHINLKRLAMEGSNVEYRREHGICNMKLRRPRVTANITSSGKITVTGSTSEAEAKVAARRVARRLQKMEFNVRFSNFRIVNVLGTCSLPFGIKLNQFSNTYPREASYEPELHPGVTYKIKNPRATMKIFSTGSITITAPCVENVGLAVEHIYPLVSDFQMEKRQAGENKKAKNSRSTIHHHHHSRPLNGYHAHDDDDDDEEGEIPSDFDSEEDDFDSDVSHD